MKQRNVPSTVRETNSLDARFRLYRQPGNQGDANRVGAAGTPGRCVDVRSWQTRIVSGVVALIDLNLSLARHSGATLS
jgi:hypothetical protein